MFDFEIDFLPNTAPDVIATVSLFLPETDTLVAQKQLTLLTAGPPVQTETLDSLGNFLQTFMTEAQAQLDANAAAATQKATDDQLLQDRTAFFTTLAEAVNGKRLYMVDGNGNGGPQARDASTIPDIQDPLNPHNGP